jgi:hypothetical protein
LPLYYDRQDGLPVRWISYIKNCIAEVSPHFTMKRMLDDYQHRFYNKLIERSRSMKKDDFHLAREIEAWKAKMKSGWSHLEVKRIAVPDPARKSLTLGNDFIAEIELKLNGIKAEDLGIDVLFGMKEMDSVKKILHKEEMKLAESAPGIAKFTCKIPMEKTGVFHYAFRLYPRNHYLPHRQDINLIKWI